MTDFSKKYPVGTWVVLQGMRTIAEQIVEWSDCGTYFYSYGYNALEKQHKNKILYEVRQKITWERVT